MKIWEEIDSLCGDIPRSRIILRILELGLEVKKRQDTEDMTGVKC